MKKDPNKACTNPEERTPWAVLHDLVCHPLMALSGYSAWSCRLHDWTSHKAWPNQDRPRTRRALGMWECYGQGLHSFGHTEEEAKARWLVFVVKMTRPRK